MSNKSQISIQNNSNSNSLNVNNLQLNDDNFTKIKLNLMGIAFSTLTKSEINVNNNNHNEEITITFNFSKGPSIALKAKLGELFKNVVKDFSNKNEIMKNYEPVAIHNCNLVNFDKTLFENYIKNGDYILFFKKIEKDNEKEEIMEDEKKQLERWLLEYKANKYSEYHSVINSLKDQKDALQLNNKIDVNPDEFIAFVFYKERECGIKVREHEHKLVYCLTLFDWKCKKCNKNYDKKIGKYYCSFCDYNMCDNCRAMGYYEKKREFPKNIPPPEVNYNQKFIISNHHEHNLAYCRTSRIVLGRTYWYCNGCKQKFNDDVWSFYCTKCDFDLCNNCAGIH